MECDFDLANKIVAEAIAGMEDCNKKVEDMVHRDDYEDYMVLFDDTTFCAIRDKLIETFYNDPEGDVKREIQYHIKNAELADEFNEYFDIGESNEEEQSTVDDI